MQESIKRLLGRPCWYLGDRYRIQAVRDTFSGILLTIRAKDKKDQTVPVGSVQFTDPLSGFSGNMHHGNEVQG